MNRKDLRNLVNTVCLVGFVIALILYISMPDNRTPFLVVCGISMVIKIAEYYVRFFR